MCDFEKASRNAFKTVFTNITIVGCWFHYTKAIHDKVQKVGLAKLYITNKSSKKWVHELMSLPFLPVRGYYVHIFRDQKIVRRLNWNL